MRELGFLFLGFPHNSVEEHYLRHSWPNRKTLSVRCAYWAGLAQACKASADLPLGQKAGCEVTFHRSLEEVLGIALTRGRMLSKSSSASLYLRDKPVGRVSTFSSDLFSVYEFLVCFAVLCVFAGTFSRVGGAAFSPNRRSVQNCFSGPLIPHLVLEVVLLREEK